MFSALKKNGDARCKLRFFRAECGQLGSAGLNGRAGQLGHIQWWKNGTTRGSNEKTAIHGVNWYFSALLGLARSFFSLGFL
jgi:hypothetical protein